MIHRYLQASVTWPAPHRVPRRSEELKTSVPRTRRIKTHTPALQPHSRKQTRKHESHSTKKTTQPKSENNFLSERQGTPAAPQLFPPKTAEGARYQPLAANPDRFALNGSCSRNSGGDFRWLFFFLLGSRCLVSLLVHSCAVQRAARVPVLHANSLPLQLWCFALAAV